MEYGEKDVTEAKKQEMDLYQSDFHIKYANIPTYTAIWWN